MFFYAHKLLFNSLIKRYKAFHAIITYAPVGQLEGRVTVGRVYCDWHAKEVAFQMIENIV